MKFFSINIIGAFFLFIFLFAFCTDAEKEKEQWKELEVDATAYNSTLGQTSGHPSEAAWGDTLKPGMKSVAVSRDLIDSGLTYGTKLQIEGLEGEYIVLDKMNLRWKKKIDIYMGESEEDAFEWGIRKVKIRWKEPVDSVSRNHQ